MEVYAQKIAAVLAEYFSPHAPSSQKQRLEGVLTQFKCRDDSWRLALHILQHESRKPADAFDAYLLWFVSSLLDDTVRRRWEVVPETDRAALRDGLLHFLLRNAEALPGFVSIKLAVTSANIARLDWPHRHPLFLNQLESALQNHETQAGSLITLSSFVEQCESVSPMHPGRQAGQVLWSRAEELALLLGPVYPGIFEALARILHTEDSQGSSGHNKPVLTCLQTVLGSLKGNHSPKLKEAVCSRASDQLLNSLFDTATASRAPTDHDKSVPLLALECIGLLIDLGALTDGRIDNVLNALKSLCIVAKLALGLDTAWLVSYIKLVCIFLKSAMSTLHKFEPLHSLLHELGGLTFAHRSSSCTLITSEVWRTISDFLSVDQESIWEASDTEVAQQKWEAKVSGVKAGLISIMDMLLSTATVANDRDDNGLLTLLSLSTVEGSGARLDELVQEVCMGSTLELEGDVQDYEDEEQGIPDCYSEAEVYTNACEIIIGQLIGELLYPHECARNGGRGKKVDSLCDLQGVFPNVMTPRILRYYCCQLEIFEACVGRGGFNPHTCYALSSLNMGLKLLARSACHLSNECLETIEGTLKLTAAWPSLRKNWADSDWATLMDRIGLSLFKALAALAATWLPKQVAGSGAVEISASMFINLAVTTVNELGPSVGWNQSSDVPSPVITAALEVLAVLTSMAVNMKKPGLANFSDEQLGCLVASAPALALRATSAAGAGSPRLTRAAYLSLTNAAVCQAAGALGSESRFLHQLQSIIGPLLECMQRAASGNVPFESVKQACLALTVSTDVFKTQPKQIRQHAFQGCMEPLMQSCLTFVHGCLNRRSSTTTPSVIQYNFAIVAYLHRIIAAVVDAFPNELSITQMDTLLGSILATSRTNPQYSGLLWVLTAPAHGGAAVRCASQCALSRACSTDQAVKVLHCFVELWEQILRSHMSLADHQGLEHGAAGMRLEAQAEPRAELGSLASCLLQESLSILQDKFQTLVPKAYTQSAISAALKAVATCQQTAASVTRTADDSESGMSEDPADGPFILHRLLSMIVQFWSESVAQSVITPTPFDVQAVLQAFIEFVETVNANEVLSHVPALKLALPALMSLLLSYRFTSIQSDVSKALYVVAGTNWQEFWSFLSHYVNILPEAHSSGSFPVDRTGILLGAFQGADSDDHTFSRATSRFLNDVQYFHSQM